METIHKDISIFANSPITLIQGRNFNTLEGGVSNFRIIFGSVKLTES